VSVHLHDLLNIGAFKELNVCLKSEYVEFARFVVIVV